MTTIIRRETTINGNPTVMTCDSKYIQTRTDFVDGREGVEFARCLKALGFAPRVLRESRTQMLVLVTTTAGDLARLLSA